ncbi:MAG: hypothetical protein ACE5Z5_04860 [Candidatus Bathyarchaeia archaeon]
MRLFKGGLLVEQPKASSTNVTLIYLLFINRLTMGFYTIDREPNFGLHTPK